MNIAVSGKDIALTEAIKSYLEKKMGRIEKYFEENEGEVAMTIKSERNEQIAEMQVSAKGESFRAVTAHKDLYASIDKDIDILEGQIRKWKTKKEKAMKQENVKMFGEWQEKKPIEMEDEIIKTIYYEPKPLTPEDAKLKLQEKPMDRFFTFVNVETGKVNVIFKLKDNKNYGLVEPDA